MEDAKEVTVQVRLWRFGEAHQGEAEAASESAASESAARPATALRVRRAQPIAAALAQVVRAWELAGEELTAELAAAQYVFYAPEHDVWLRAALPFSAYWSLLSKTRRLDVCTMSDARREAERLRVLAARRAARAHSAYDALAAFLYGASAATVLIALFELF